MIIRTWTTGVDEARADEYERFAEQISTPMFAAQQGFRGVVFARSEGERIVSTWWEDAASIEALEASATYRETVAAILRTGFLREPQSVTVHEVTGVLGVTVGTTTRRG